MLGVANKVDAPTGNQDLLWHGVRPAAGDIGGADLARRVVILANVGFGLAETDRTARGNAKPVFAGRRAYDAISANWCRREIAVAVKAETTLGRHIEGKRLRATVQ